MEDSFFNRVKLAEKRFLFLNEMLVMLLVTDKLSNIPRNKWV